MMEEINAHQPPSSPFEARRGRPKLSWTPKRRQVYDELVACVQNADRVTLAELARRCGLTDYRNARRIVNDLKQMGAVK